MKSNWAKLGQILDFEVDFIDAENIGLPPSFGKITLIKDIGAKKGMLIFPDGTSIMPYANSLAEKGYGFSVVAHPDTPFLEQLESCIDMLKDWGWSGRCRVD